MEGGEDVRHVVSGVGEHHGSTGVVVPVGDVVDFVLVDYPGIVGGDLNGWTVAEVVRSDELIADGQLKLSCNTNSRGIIRTNDKDIQRQQHKRRLTCFFTSCQVYFCGFSANFNAPLRLVAAAASPPFPMVD